MGGTFWELAAVRPSKSTSYGGPVCHLGSIFSYIVSNMIRGLYPRLLAFALARLRLSPRNESNCLPRCTRSLPASLVLSRHTERRLSSLSSVRCNIETRHAL